MIKNKQHTIFLFLIFCCVSQTETREEQRNIGQLSAFTNNSVNLPAKQSLPDNHPEKLASASLAKASDVLKQSTKQPPLTQARQSRRNTGQLSAFTNNQTVAPREQPLLVAQNDPHDLPVNQSLNNLPEKASPVSLAEASGTLKQPTEQQPALQQDELVLPLELLSSSTASSAAISSSEPARTDATIELNFEDADLTTFVKQVEALFNITFITNEMIKRQNATAVPGAVLEGNKISFKTIKPLTKKETWDLFLAFLDIAGFTVVPEPNPGMYRIQSVDSARKAPIPAYIGVDYSKLPDNDQLIRYAYFIENSTVDFIAGIVESLKSPDAPVIKLTDNKAILITDKSYNIKTLMQIVKELDQVSMPQAMSVIKLRHADALQVEALYKSLASPGDQGRPFPPIMRKPSTALFFPETARVIAEPRTNSLIILGQRDAIQKIEEFVIKHVDVELDQPFSPLFVVQLNYASAENIANIMTAVTQFGSGTEAGRTAGLRAQDKYLGQMTFTPQKETNRIIIRGSYDDYLKAKKTIIELDQPQPQVAIEVLILSMSIDDVRALGTQLRNKKPGPDGFIGPNVDFQTSGLHTGTANTPVGIQQNTSGTGAERLLANLLTAVVGAGPGNTIISLGRDIFGVWGVLQLLQTMTSLQVLSNPFLIATNKTPSQVSIGETRRVTSGSIIPGGGSPTTPTFDNDSANLAVSITPTINSDGMIVLNLEVQVDNFINPASSTLAAAEKNTKRIKTQIIVANKEVIALGGLVRNTITDNLSKVPILGDIPVFGWLFKNKLKQVDRENLLILISSRIIPPDQIEEVNKFTQERVLDYHGMLDQMHTVAEKRDPIHKFFFAPQTTDVEKAMDDFIFERGKKNLNSRRGRRKRKEQELLVKKQQPQTPQSAPAAQPLTVNPASTTVIAHQKSSVPQRPSMPTTTESTENTKVVESRRKNRLSLSAIDELQKGSA